MTCRFRLIKASQNFIRFCLFSHRTPFIFLHSVKTWCWKFETKSFGENYLYTLKTAQFFQASKRSEHMVNVIMASWFFSLSFITTYAKCKQWYIWQRGCEISWNFHSLRQNMYLKICCRGQFLDGGARLSLERRFSSINFPLFHLCSGKQKWKKKVKKVTECRLYKQKYIIITNNQKPQVCRRL